MTKSGEPSPAIRELAAKYLTFRLGAEEYGIKILRVREIIGLMNITPVPRTQRYVRGVINLRGRIIPVLDLRTRFGMEAIGDTEETSIIVVDTDATETSQMGLLVDGVCEVLDISAEEIEPPPSFGDDVDLRFLRAVAKCRGEVKLLLDTDHVLNVSSDPQHVEATNNADSR